MQGFGSVLCVAGFEERVQTPVTRGGVAQCETVDKIKLIAILNIAYMQIK